MAALAGVLVSMVTSWTLSQALAYLGYTRMSRLDPDGAARLLRAGLPIGTAALGVVLGVCAVLAPVGAGVLLFAGAQGVYLLAATVLLVRRAYLTDLSAVGPGGSNPWRRLRA